jgi:hypothetical protein
MPYRTVFITVLFLMAHLTWAQKSSAKQDTLSFDSIPLHSPVKASVMSAVLPGLGQAYNKKYWKIPIIYAAMATTVYLSVDLNSRFKNYKQAYIYRTDNDPNTIDPYELIYNDQTMVQLVDYYKRNRDFMYILTGLVYALNIIDASVDAHLFYFDVSDDLSLKITPNIQAVNFSQSRQKGFSITLNF